jgi:O-antigen/teichoic acid export membrane protein
MLQLAAYVNYLDFGVQTAVARYLAGALEKHDSAQSNRLLSNSVAILSVGGMIALCVLGALVWQLPHIFHSVPVGLSGEIGAGVLILGIGAAIGLPLSAYTGVLIGMQRNEFPALVIASTRLLSAVAVVTVAHYTQSLAWLALCVAGFNLLAALLQYAIVKKMLPTIHCAFVHLDRAMTLELIRYCSALSIWSIGMLLISGLDVTLVGLFNFKAVGAYSIASTLVMFFTGLVGAAFSAMMAPVAVLQARQEFDRIARLVIYATRLNSYISLAAIAGVFLFGEAFIRAWVGSTYLPITLPVLKLLVIAQGIRLVCNAFGTVLVGMGLQRQGLIPVMVEGSTNLVLSVLGMLWFGPVGVAWATLIASSMALILTIFFVMPRIREIRIRPYHFLKQGVLRPALPFLPVIFWLFIRRWYSAVVSSYGLVAALPEATLILLTIGLLVRSAADLRRLKT